MKLSGVLVAVCMVTCGLFTALLAPDAASATFLGMAAPLAVGLATILLVEHTARTDVRRLTGRMTIAFVVKMVFYALHVSIVIGVLRINPLPFTISFTLYFAALHVAEALHFKTLFSKAAANAVSD